MMKIMRSTHVQYEVEFVGVNMDQVTLLICSLLLLTSCTHAQNLCSTPNNTEGQCVTIKRCQVIVDALQERPLSEDTIVYLRRSQCGYSNDQPDVCCPRENFKRRKFMLPIEYANKVRESRTQLASRFGGESQLVPPPGECGTQTIDNKIFNGVITGIDEYPWMALLKYKDTDAFACGGSLINSRYVLTAAHCVNGPLAVKKGGLISVRLGEHNTEVEPDCDQIVPDDCAPSPIDVGIEKQIVHPQYQPNNLNQYHDIALLKLAQEVEFSDFVRPVCISKNVTVVAPMFVAGWGQTEKARSSPIKLKLKVPMMTPAKCTQAYKRFNINVGKSQICAGGQRGEDACAGDSGGPLITSVVTPETGMVWYLVGITSIGPTPCAQARIPGIYTKVTDYYDWIVANMK